jgi:hypothetical protein
MKPKLFQRLDGMNTLVTPTANKINSAIKPNTKKVRPTGEPKLAREPACQPISTTGNCY